MSDIRDRDVGSDDSRISSMMDYSGMGRPDILTSPIAQLQLPPKWHKSGESSSDGGLAALPGDAATYESVARKRADLLPMVRKS